MRVSSSNSTSLSRHQSWALGSQLVALGAASPLCLLCSSCLPLQGDDCPQLFLPPSIHCQPLPAILLSIPNHTRKQCGQVEEINTPRLRVCSATIQLWASPAKPSVSSALTGPGDFSQHLPDFISTSLAGKVSYTAGT